MSSSATEGENEAKPQIPERRGSLKDRVSSLFRRQSSTSDKSSESSSGSPVSSKKTMISNRDPEDCRICIVGAGLAGCMAAALLAKLKDKNGRNFHISVYEKREDPRTEEVKAESFSEAFGASTSATKRSINLALSFRGQMALKEAGLLEVAMENAVPMPCRVIHSVDGSVVTQAYGKVGEALQVIFFY